MQIVIVKMYALISIHALLAESDWSSPRATMHTWKFLSTLSLRRATGKPKALKSRRIAFLSTLSLRRATFGRAVWPGLSF